jgi:hypothetical protein
MPSNCHRCIGNSSPCCWAPQDGQRVDAVLDNPEIRALEPLDRINSRNQLRQFAQVFAGGDDLVTPGVSPLRGPLDHLGHLTIFAGTRDILTPDVRLLARTAGAGTTVDVLEYDRGHAFMLLDSADGAAVARDAAGTLHSLT